MLKIEDEFYRYQTKVRNLFNKSSLVELCQLESKRFRCSIGDEVEKIRKIKNHKVLDAPCGYGNLLFFYRSLGLNAIGFDIDKNQIKLAEILDLNAHVGDINKILNREDKYNLISSIDFLEHLEKDQAINLLMNFNNSLVEGGILILRLPCADFPMGLRDFAEDPTHKWIGTSNCLISMLKMTNFTEIKIIEDWPLFMRATYLRNFLAKLSRGLIRLLLKTTGYGVPKCLSSSMIVIAKK